MHDLIEDLGKEIVRQESSYEPGERSRLWFYKDILQVLQQDTGTNKVKAIILDLPKGIEVQWSGEAFEKMRSLKMLVIKKACFSECPKYLPNSLKWLEWKGYPFKILPFRMRLTELVYLDLSYSYCECLQPFDKNFFNLSHMNLRNCKFLKQIPDLSGASNLRELWLDGCTNLIEVHDSVGCLNKLTVLSAMRCKKLKILPSCLRLSFLKHLNLIGCSSLQRFPEISVMMEEIRILDLDKTAIIELPSSICNLIGLEMINVEECRNLKQLPSSICKLRKLWKLTVDSCEEMSHFKMCEGGDEASLDCSKMTHLHFSNCKLSDNSLVFCLSHFTKIEHLDLSFNNFTILPECIKEHCNLKYLLLDNCNQLQHIGGMPPNLEKFSAICCTSLTKLSKSKVLKQGSFVSFWVRNVFPRIFLWILVKDDQDYIHNCQFSAHTNEYTKLDISSMWHSLSTIKTNHIYICDMQSMIQSELPLGNEWNEVNLSIESKTQEIELIKEIYFGVYADNLQSSFENIQFVDPIRCIIDISLLQNIQGQQDLEELEEDMNLDLNSTKSAELIENPMHDRDREIMNKLQPWDLRFLEVAGYRGTTFPTWLGSRSYNDLTELRLINCQNCRRIPALGQLPALRDLTIEGLQSVVAVGSEFFKGHDCASLIPFPSLESLKFANMISWEEWHSVDMEAFPKLHTLRFDCCPKLIGNLPLQLVSLECLEIATCPLLASSIPKYPRIHILRIIKSQNVVLQEQALPPSLHFLEFSDARMLEPLSEKLHIEHLVIRNFSDAAPLPVIHMPPSAVENLDLIDCENLKFVLISKAPLVHLEIIFIYKCKFLKSLLADMERLLPNLRQLRIVRCPEMEPFCAGSLPSSLKQLEIRGCNKLLSSHTEWHHLPTITKLLISTPSDTLHCRGLQHLTSLQELRILDSPKLKTIKGGMI
ncbi:hypothetical protein K1719_001550 [Acacia pycnantha]|nr:hypothetical protein K1719_001550 [Acacia pycnantha]